MSSKRVCAEPASFRVGGFGQGDAPEHERSERTRLRERLSVLLVDPGERSVGRDHDERHVLIERLRHGWQEVEQSRSGGHAEGDGPFVEGASESEESGASLIGDGESAETSLDEIMDQWGIARSGAEDGTAQPVSYEQRSEDIDVVFVAKHRYFLLFFVFFNLNSHPNRTKNTPNSPQT